MPDNLTIQISADTGKARADLELLKGKLQELGRDMRAARAEALKTGDRTNLDRLAKDYEAVSRSAKGLQQQLRATNAEVASPAWGAAAKAAATLNQEISGLAKSSLGFAAGIGGALLSTVNLLGKTSDQLLELKRLSQSTGFSPGAIKAFNETLEDTGQEAGAGNRGLVKLSQAFGEVRQAARAAGQAVGSAMTILRPDDPKEPLDTFGVQQLRGGQAPRQIKDVADALSVLQVNMKKFKDDAAGNDAALQAIIDGFARLARQGRIDEGNLAAMQLWGKNMRETVPAIKALAGEAGGLKKAMDALRAEGRFPDDAALAQAAAYHKAQKDIGDEWDRLGFFLLKTFGPSIQEQMRLFANDIETMRQSIVNLSATFADMFAQVGQGFTDLGNLIAGWARTAWDAINSVVSAVKALPGTTAAGDMPPMPMAGGGMIRGPGSGTSDSILARLSNGEFVMRAAAVSKWGPQFMAALNGLRNPFGYAGGGLVPRFATGGLVAAGGGGTPVHLHLGGHSFALSGNDGVVGALVTEAHRQRMRSAGTKPSWYGGH